MEIRLAIDSTAPLVGTATAGTVEPLHFEGWLELLRAIATLTGAEDYPLGDTPQHGPPPAVGEAIRTEPNPTSDAHTGARGDGSLQE